MDRSIIGGVVFAVSGVLLLLVGSEDLRAYGEAALALSAASLGLTAYSAKKQVQKDG